MSTRPINFDEILEEYRKLWKHRLLTNNEKSSEEILAEAIHRELMDENSHPRIRKSKQEKFFYAVKRIIDSTISGDAKLELINLHVQKLEEINRG